MTWTMRATTDRQTLDLTLARCRVMRNVRNLCNVEQTLPCRERRVAAGQDLELWIRLSSTLMWSRVAVYAV